MKLSVAMCTYNGAKYIREQIESILNQELRVDEIVICDDGSKDGTIAIIKELINKYKTNIRLYQNEQNLGFVRNFSKSISLCKGDIIFLSDQDDIWMQNKTRQIINIFCNYPNIDLISTDANLINEENKPYSKETLWEVTHLNCFHYFEDHDMIPEFFAATGRVTGATVAFRNIAPYNEFLKYQGNFGYHDETITFMAISAGKYYPLEERLINYRLSSTQSCGLDRRYFDRDIRIPFEFASNFHSLPLNSKWKERIDFMEERLIYKFRPWRILYNRRIYRKCYKDKALNFMMVDVRRTLQEILYRLHIVKKREWRGRMHPIYMI